MFREQSSFGVCYAHKIGKGEAEIDWTRGAVQIRNHIHGLSPAPGAFSNLSIGGRLERIKILRVEVIGANGVPGTILDNQMTVACGDGAIRIIEGQRAGRAAMPGPDIMRGEQAFLRSDIHARRKVFISASRAVLSSFLMASAALKI